MKYLLIKKKKKKVQNLGTISDRMGKKSRNRTPIKDVICAISKARTTTMT
jgi:hypothetical protein